MKTPRIVLATTSVAGAAIAAAIALGAPGWQALEPRSNSVASVVDTAVSPSGDMAVIYRPDGSTRLFLNQTSAGTWGTPCELTTGGTTVSNTNDARVAMNARGDVVAAWRLAGAGTGIAASFRPAGGGCGVGEQIAPSGSPAGSSYTSAAIDPAGRAYVGWASTSNTGQSQVRVRGTDGTWGAPAGIWPDTLGAARGLQLGVIDGPKVVAAVVTSDRTAVRMRVFDPASGAWTPAATAVTDPQGDGLSALLMATNAARGDVRIIMSEDNGTDVFTARVGDPSAIPAPAPVTRVGGGTDPNTQTIFPGSAVMNASGQAGLMWEVSDNIGQPDTVSAAVCGPSDAPGACTSEVLESYTTAGSVPSLAVDTVNPDYLSIASDGRATAIWRRITDNAIPPSGRLRYATRPAAGTWSAAADVPGTGGAATFSMGEQTSGPQLDGDATGAFTIVGSRASDGVVASLAFTQPAAAPDAPVAAGGASGEAALSWSTLTANTGFAPITGYAARAVEDPSRSCTTTGTSCTITGLTAGHTYRFVLTATNAAGTSAASPASGPVTVPAAPQPAPPAKKPRLTVRRGATITSARLVTTAGLRRTAGSRVTLRVAGRKGGLVARRKGGLVARRAGTYQVTVSVIPRRGKANRRVVTVVVR